MELPSLFEANQLVGSYLDGWDDLVPKIEKDLQRLRLLYTNFHKNLIAAKALKDRVRPAEFTEFALRCIWQQLVQGCGSISILQGDLSIKVVSDRFFLGRNLEFIDQWSMDELAALSKILFEQSFHMFSGTVENIKTLLDEGKIPGAVDVPHIMKNLYITADDNREFRVLKVSLLFQTADPNKVKKSHAPLIPATPAPFNNIGGNMGSASNGGGNNSGGNMGGAFNAAGNNTGGESSNVGGNNMGGASSNIGGINMVGASSNVGGSNMGAAFNAGGNCMGSNRGGSFNVGGSNMGGNTPPASSFSTVFSTPAPAPTASAAGAFGFGAPVAPAPAAVGGVFQFGNAPATGSGGFQFGNASAPVPATGGGGLQFGNASAPTPAPAAPAPTAGGGSAFGAAKRQRVENPSGPTPMQS